VNQEEVLSYSEFDADNELDDPAPLDAVVNDSSNEDDSITQDFVWENMQNYKRQKENFMVSVTPQGAAKRMTNCGRF
jgi:cytochrome c556